MGSRPKQANVVAFVYIAGLFMSIVDTTIIYTALPSVARQFHTTAASAEWVIIGYLLSLAVWMPSSGWLGDRFGTKVTFLFALGLFTATSALCGISGSLVELVVFRVLQGIGGGMLAPVGQAMLFRAFPAAERARASALVATGTTLAPAVGPVMGGVLVTQLSWRWCFYVNVPIGLIALVYGIFFLDEHREPAAGRLDVAGFLLAGGGLALVLYAMSEGPSHGWSDPTIVVTGTVGVVAVVALVLVELHQRQPMLPLRLLNDRIFRTTNLVSVFTSGAYGAYLFLMPEFLQNARRATALSSGLTTFPGAIGLTLMSQVAARLYTRVGPRKMVTIGSIGVAVGFTVMTQLSVSTNTWLIRGLCFYTGSCSALSFIALQAASFATISSADTGGGSAIFNTQRQVATALGVAVVVTVVSSWIHLGPGGQLPAPAAQVSAYHHAFLTVMILTVIGAGFGAAIRDSDAAGTMTARSKAGDSKAGDSKAE